MIFRNNYKIVYLIAVNQKEGIWRYNELTNPYGFLQMNYSFSENEITKTFPYSEKIISKILNMQNESENIRVYG
jgi:hypothetical protein